MIDPDKKANLHLDFAKQHMQRFREYEDIEWRINFSVWAFFGALAYLWVNGHLVMPPWMTTLGFRIKLVISAAVLHAIAIVTLNYSGAKQAASRDDHRRAALNLMDIDGDSIYPKHSKIGGFWPRYWLWMVWEVLVTAVIALAVLLFLQNAVVQQNNPPPGTSKISSPSQRPETPPTKTR